MPELPELPPRLAAVRERIPRGARVADIGTDHALLPLRLALAGDAAAVVATERTAPRLRAAREAVARAGDAGAGIVLRAGDGLLPLAPEDRIDVLTVCGLGGRSIARILDPDALERLGVRRLVLQPQGQEALLRRHLDDCGWRLVEEALVPDGERLYAVLAAERGIEPTDWDHPTLDREDLLVAGPLLVRSGSPAVRMFWERRLAGLLEILRTTPGAPRTRADAERARRILDALLSAPAGRTPASSGRRGSSLPPRRKGGPGSSRRS